MRLPHGAAGLHRPGRADHHRRPLRDPRTLYSGAQRIHHQWPDSRLITLPNAIQHGIYAEYGNACADHQVNTYLATSRLVAAAARPSAHALLTRGTLSQGAPCPCSAQWAR
ncbi:alpha/beta hydrolase [Streptomyces fulvoviolaceus]|uniref:alpha/beta hydrolase n=1 Tax=Streptomyces fulvoviolaceus TaxID=285535 RepID=UPI0036F3DC70